MSDKREKDEGLPSGSGQPGSSSGTSGTSEADPGDQSQRKSEGKEREGEEKERGTGRDDEMDEGPDSGTASKESHSMTLRPRASKTPSAKKRTRSVLKRSQTSAEAPRPEVDVTGASSTSDAEEGSSKRSKKEAEKEDDEEKELDRDELEAGPSTSVGRKGGRPKGSKNAPSIQLKHPCGTCGVLFPRHWDAVRHQRVCVLCPKCKRYVDKRHVDKCEGKARKEPEELCVICRKFLSRKNLKRHMKKVHKMEHANLRGPTREQVKESKEGQRLKDIEFATREEELEAMLKKKEELEQEIQERQAAKDELEEEIRRLREELEREKEEQAVDVDPDVVLAQVSEDEPLSAEDLALMERTLDFEFPKNFKDPGHYDVGPLPEYVYERVPGVVSDALLEAMPVDVPINAQVALGYVRSGRVPQFVVAYFMDQVSKGKKNMSKMTAFYKSLHMMERFREFALVPDYHHLADVGFDTAAAINEGVLAGEKAGLSKEKDSSKPDDDGANLDKEPSQPEEGASKDDDDEKSEKEKS